MTDVNRFEREFLGEMRANHGALLEQIRTSQEMSDESDKALTAILDEFTKKFA